MPILSNPYFGGILYWITFCDMNMDRLDRLIFV